MVFEAPTDDIEKMRPPLGEAVSFTAEEDVIAGQVVKLSGDNAVAPSDTDGEPTYGIAMQTVPAGDDLNVNGSGVRCLFTAGDTVTAGDKLTSHGGSGEEGEVAPADATDDYVIGYAHEGASEGDTFVGVVDRGGEIN